MNYAQLLEQVRQEAIQFFHANENPGLPYHNLTHTQMVVANAGQIARHYQLDDKDFFIVTAAAWFHDIGYYVSGASGHEQSGTEKAESLLTAKGVGEDIIQQVKNCIMATCMPQNPKTLLERIVCDADLYHLGTHEFANLNKLVRKEVEARTGKKISKSDWRKGAIRLLEAHEYQTDYARATLSAGKKENLEKLRQKEEEAVIESSLPPLPTQPEPHSELIPQSQPPSEAFAPSQPVPPSEAATIKKPKSDRPDRGIETMFRISSNNHQRLSDMADNKAHIMITTTSIIMSVLISVLLRKLEDNPHLVVPTVLLLAVCVVTLVFSILATRPSLPKGTFTPQDITDKKVNLLFFGNFYKMDYEDYSSGMRAMMNDRDFLYGSLTRDVYSQGIVLGRKYRYLRIGYNIFMYGVIVSVLAFVFAAIYFGK